MITTPDPETTLAAGPIDDVDAFVLTQIRHLHEVLDPLPADLTDRITFAMSVAALEAEVAEIVSSATLETVRSTQYDRADTVTFASDGLSVMVSIEPGATLTVDIAGWVSETDVEVELLLPYDRGDLLSRVHEHGEVLTTEHTEAGTRVRAKVHAQAVAALAAYRV